MNGKNGTDIPLDVARNVVWSLGLFVGMVCVIISSIRKGRPRGSGSTVVICLLIIGAVNTVSPLRTETQSYCATAFVCLALSVGLADALSSAALVSHAHATQVSIMKASPSGHRSAPGFVLATAKDVSFFGKLAYRLLITTVLLIALSTLSNNVLSSPTSLNPSSSTSINATIPPIGGDGY